MHVKCQPLYDLIGLLSALTCLYQDVNEFALPWLELEYLQELSRQIQLRQASGYTVAKYSSGVAHDASDMHVPLANLHFLVLLLKSSR